MRKWYLIFIVSLSACDADSGLPRVSHSAKGPTVSAMTETKVNYEFSCSHEVIPPPDTDVDVLFKYARWLQENNRLRPDKKVSAEVERLYRIASENGHYKANINLQNGAMRQHFQLDGAEYLRLSQQLIDAGVATGYYFVGLFLKNGSAGLKQDSEMAMRYFRKSADQGSALGQHYVGEQFAKSKELFRVGEDMRRCAAEQGVGQSAVMLGIYLKASGEYRDAIEIFQLGVAAGDENAAGWLADGFRTQDPTDELNYLGQEEDLERAARYHKIWKYLAGYSYTNPKVPEINEIVPLPPAKLPDWDGKLQWVEARRANVPPEKPSEELITQLANAKKLDPMTGKPMPGSPAFSQSNFPLQICSPGEACPQEGYWKVIWPTGSNVRQQDVVRYFKEGEILPTQIVERYRSRSWPLRENVSFKNEAVEWGLIG